MLYAISGKKRHGKDTFYLELESFLLENTKLRVQRLKFADPIYQWTEKYFGIPIYFWENDDFKEKNRYILQGLGECIREEIDRSYWVNKSLEQYIPDDKTVYITTDLRHENECEAVLRVGGKPLRVIRPDKVSSDTHITEIALDNYGGFLHVFNNTTYSSYKEEIKKWAVQEFKKYILPNQY
jgi:hypothetical protein